MTYTPTDVILFWTGSSVLIAMASVGWIAAFTILLKDSGLFGRGK